MEAVESQLQTALPTDGGDRAQDEQVRDGDAEPDEEDPLAADVLFTGGDGGDIDHAAVVEKAKRRRLLPGAAQSAAVFRLMLRSYRDTWTNRAPTDVAAASGHSLRTPDAPLMSFRHTLACRII